MVPDIKYISGENNIAADVLSLLPNNRNQKTTHESTYLTKTMSKLEDIKLQESTFLLYFKLVYHYSRKTPFLMEKLKCEIYKNVYFPGFRNTIKPITFNNKIVILQLLQ